MLTYKWLYSAFPKCLFWTLCFQSNNLLFYSFTKLWQYLCCLDSRLCFKRKNFLLHCTGFSEWLWCWFCCSRTGWIPRELLEPEFTARIFPFGHRKWFHITGRWTPKSLICSCPTKRIPVKNLLCYYPSFIGWSFVSVLSRTTCLMDHQVF